MPKPNCVWVELTARGSGLRVPGNNHCPQPAAPSPQLTVALVLILSGCATPQYAIRGTPVPDESPEALTIERSISAVQAQAFERQGARPIGLEERVSGFAVQHLVDRLSTVTERPSLRYRAFLYRAPDPNAAALADGRIYVSSGLMTYLSQRGRREERMPSDVEAELAFVLGHEIGHTVAQHLVKRYHTLQQQQLLMSLVAVGAAAAARGASTGAQAAGRLAMDVASMLQDVANSGYSQAQELEADQLGIRYVIRAGYEPTAALDLLQDFARFDSPSPFLRTHPYIVQRRADLERYLADLGSMGSERVRRLRQAQALYPKDSISWKNLQQQIDRLETPQ